MFWETKTPKKNPYISGNRNPKKLLIYQKMKKKVHPEKISYTPEKRNFLTPILRNFSYFL